MSLKLPNLLKGLQNFLLCRYYRLRGLYDYPQKILPDTSHIPIIDIASILKDLEHCYVVRRSHSPTSDIFTSVGTLRDDVIGVKEIPNLSMNLLGGHFDDTHIIFVPKEKGMMRWDGKEKIYFIDYVNFYETHQSVSPIYFPVKSLHNITFPYYRDGQDKTIKSIVEKFQLANHNGKYKFSGKSLVAHDPTNLNYWHVELSLEDINGNKIKNANSSWAKSAAEAISHILTSCASPDKPPRDKIERKFYQKKYRKSD